MWIYILLCEYVCKIERWTFFIDHFIQSFRLFRQSNWKWVFGHNDSYYVISIITVSVSIEVNISNEWISKSMLFTSYRNLFPLFKFVLSFMCLLFFAFVNRKPVFKFHVYSENQSVFIHFVPAKKKLSRFSNYNKNECLFYILFCFFC